MENFRKELENLINKHSLENESNTPDFMLATYIVSCLENYNEVIKAREKWYGRKNKITNGSWGTDEHGEPIWVIKESENEITNDSWSSNEHGEPVWIMKRKLDEDEDSDIRI